MTFDRRIAIVSHSHPSLSKGGAEIAAYTLFEGLKALGENPLFVAACPEGDEDRVTLGAAERLLTYQPSIYDSFYQLASPDIGVRLDAILREEGVGLVNFHHFMNIGVGALQSAGQGAEGERLTKVMTLHEFLPICHHHGQMVTRPARLLCDRATPERCVGCFPEYAPEKFVQRRDSFLDAFATMDGFVSPSQFLADRYANWGLPPQAIAVIENGLPDTRQLEVTEHATEGRIWTFGFFGQINPFKGVDTLLDAAELIGEMPELAGRVRLRIHGNLVGQPDSFIKRFGEVVDRHAFLTYTGAYSNAAVKQLMSQCDYVVVPSNWWENSPIVIQEAYAAGRPVLCSDIGGMAEKVREGVSGMHFRVGDAADMVRVLERAANPELAMLLQSGLPKVAGAEGMARDYLAAFRALTQPAAAVLDGPQPAMETTASEAPPVAAPRVRRPRAAAVEQP